MKDKYDILLSIPFSKEILNHDSDIIDLYNFLRKTLLYSTNNFFYNLDEKAFNHFLTLLKEIREIDSSLNETSHKIIKFPSIIDKTFLFKYFFNFYSAKYKMVKIDNLINFKNKNESVREKSILINKSLGELSFDDLHKTIIIYLQDGFKNNIQDDRLDYLFMILEGIVFKRLFMIYCMERQIDTNEWNLSTFERISNDFIDFIRYGVVELASLNSVSLSNLLVDAFIKFIKEHFHGEFTFSYSDKEKAAVQSIFEKEKKEFFQNQANQAFFKDDLIEKENEMKKHREKIIKELESSNAFKNFVF